MRIGVLGGTFDPIHKGHLYLAKKISSELSLDSLIFIPAYLPPHKKGVKITLPIHRYRMAKLAIGKNKRFNVSGIELRRKGKSYSVETLRKLRKLYGKATNIFFITGSDSLRDIASWKNLEEILKLCRFVVVRRPGFPVKKRYRDFTIIDISAKNISASAIRRNIKRGLSVKGLIPHKVDVYIRKHRLYR